MYLYIRLTCTHTCINTHQIICKRICIASRLLPTRLQQTRTQPPVPEPVVEPAALDMETNSTANEVTEDVKFDVGVAMPEALT